jgi:hypothetical protein
VTLRAQKRKRLKSSILGSAKSTEKHPWETLTGCDFESARKPCKGVTFRGFLFSNDIMQLRKNGKTTPET